MLKESAAIPVQTAAAIFLCSAANPSLENDMSLSRPSHLLGTCALLAACSLSMQAQQIKTVFVIAMENHNWTQPAQLPGKIQQIYQNPNAPFINSLVNGTAKGISNQVAYANAYHNVLATPSGNNPHIHPSEPNYIWAEAGDNLGIFNDNDPFAASGPTNQTTNLHLATLLSNSGHTWKSYQEDIDLAKDANGKLTNVPLSPDQYTVPLSSFSGNFSSGVNQFNGSTQYNYAAKHNPMVIFDDTDGGNNPTTSNPLRMQYAPLQQLFTDLANNSVAEYNWITPDQYNDQHTALTGGYKGLTGDSANIKQGDDFLAQVVPVIMASKAYQDNGVIILWWDEAESDGASGDNADDFNHTIPEIIISKHARQNVNGVPYASTVNLTHSSDLKTMEEIFHLTPLLRDAANVPDLSDLFQPGAIPGDHGANRQ